MKKFLAALILGTVALSSTVAPARAQSMPGELGGSLGNPAVVAGVAFVVLAAIIVGDDDDDSVTTTTTNP